MICDTLLKQLTQNQTHASSARGPRDPRTKPYGSRHTGRLREWAGRVIGPEAELKMKPETLGTPFIIWKPKPLLFYSVFDSLWLNCSCDWKLGNLIKSNSLFPLLVLSQFRLKVQIWVVPETPCDPCDDPDRPMVCRHRQLSCFWDLAEHHDVPAKEEAQSWRAVLLLGWPLSFQVGDWWHLQKVCTARGDTLHSWALPFICLWRTCLELQDSR